MVGGEVRKAVRTGKACSRATYVKGMENTHAYPVQRNVGGKDAMGMG